MNARGKTIDTTYLPIVGHTSTRGYIHRDYLAHCLRYSHVAKYLGEQKRCRTAHILDVGCGREAPLPRLLRSMMLTSTTGSYTGVDYGPIDWPWPETSPAKARVAFIPNVDFAEAKLPRERFDLITSFEMLEHVEGLHAWMMLRRMRSLLASGGVAFLSTPCYDAKVGAAKNHVNEMSFEAFMALVQSAGLEVVQVHGTFASRKDYKPLMSPAIRNVFDQLASYYDSGVLACLFAPLFPAQARNCLWRVRAAASCLSIKAPLMAIECASSARWAADCKQINKLIAKGGL